MKLLEIIAEVITVKTYLLGLKLIASVQGDNKFEAVLSTCCKSTCKYLRLY